MPSLYAFGSNESGQLGVGHNDDLDQPEKCIFLDTSDTKQDSALWNDLSISFGGNHTIIVNKTSGKVYGAGDNKVCQLGADSVVTTNKFIALCKEPEYEQTKFVLTASMWETSMLVDESGYIYTTGSGQFGELGNSCLKDVKNKIISKLQKIPNIQLPSRAIKSSSGMRHVVILCENGDVWGWGANRKGQVDNESDEKIVWKPRKVATEIKDIGCGKDFLVLLSNDGKLEFRGNKQRFDNTLDEFIETHNSEKDQPVGILSVGWSSIHIITTSHTQQDQAPDQQQVYAFGSDVHDQLYPYSMASGTKNPHLFSHVVSGTEHYLAIESNAVKSWGWGEHGNCGKGYRSGLKEIYEISTTDQYKNPQIFGGYASSWINSL